MPTIGRTDLDVFPLSLGGNVFGWTSDEQTSFEVLDAFVEGGGNFIDTADVYSAWIEGNSGGESETIIGNWMASRGNRDAIVLATKVGSLETAKGLSRSTIRRAVQDSLRRLQTDRIDLYWAHRDDPATPQEETVAAFDELVREGTVRVVGASNYSADRLSSALQIARDTGAARFEALQPEYNLVVRKEFEADLLPVVAEHGLSTVPYYALASGFLTGKYRDASADDSSPRAGQARSFLDDRGRGVLAELDAIAAAHDTSVTAVSLAWLAAQPTVLAPIASARIAQQVPDLLAGGRLTLTDDEIARLTAASE
ncbi:aldo/keto reductase [Nakamurella flavida]|uniref:Aldo/keto reductase n=1 Tax=Nakamurella flavida TaxID=363630 RepID=A0A938YIT9_9ACTN|nr:aldo/keto reductase [Nakamurella flavida]MBM9475533.1 aldo/keto reductase [Nakamurella flavida]MDP9778192.1 aryl-alcohol dehydrogenase-like predicted oxidoreductase [Nakamurella flavida]